MTTAVESIQDTLDDLLLLVVHGAYKCVQFRNHGFTIHSVRQSLLDRGMKCQERMVGPRGFGKLRNK